MFKAAFSNFLTNNTAPELNTTVFQTDSDAVSAGCINNPYTNAIVLTGNPNVNYFVSNKGSYAATVSFQAGQTNKNFGPFGLTIYAFPALPTYINYGWLLQDDGTALIQESGSNVTGTSSSYTTSTVFKILYTDNSIKYYRDGVLVRTVLGVYTYLYAGINLVYTDDSSSINNFIYDRYETVTAQPAPYTITFQPSSINFEDQFVSKVVYVMPDRVVTKNFTFSSLQDALTGSTKDIDSRSNYSYTFYNAPSGDITYTVTISAILFPSLSAFEYQIRIPVTTPYLTRNPVLTSTNNCVFDGVYLLKNKAWGSNNTMLFIAEGLNNDNTNQLFLLSASCINI